MRGAVRLCDRHDVKLVWNSHEHSLVSSQLLELTCNHGGSDLAMLSERNSEAAFIPTAWLHVFPVACQTRPHITLLSIDLVQRLPDSIWSSLLAGLCARKRI